MCVCVCVLFSWSVCVCAICFRFVVVFIYSLLAVPEIISLIKKYCEVVFLIKKSIVNKMCCKLNPFDSVIPAENTQTYKLLC